jgi:hypothetical protein
MMPQNEKGWCLQLFGVAQSPRSLRNQPDEIVARIRLVASRPGNPKFCLHNSFQIWTSERGMITAIVTLEHFPSHLTSLHARPHLIKAPGELGFEPSFQASASQSNDTGLTMEALYLQEFTIQPALIYIIVALG